MNNIQKEICRRIDENQKWMDDAVDYIWAHPEVGYKEWKTSAYLEEQFTKLGYSLTKPDGIPGFIAEWDSGAAGPTVAVLGELDALMCATHPDANPETKAVHACGHVVQVSAMLGIAAVLAGWNPQLCGKVRFVAVPAEETIDLEFRSNLIKKGIIRYMAGKIEFLRRGLLDGVDMAMMMHADTREDVLFKFIDGCDGCITKHFEYKGVAAHAGGAPHKGINALYAASLGLDACNSLRETFQEKDFVRYHPIITQAGVAANAIPDRAHLDTYVRAASLEAMLQTNKKINRALAASAAALGANVTVSDRPGNLPFRSNKIMTERLRTIITDIFGKNVISDAGWDTQSSDVGDLSSLIPVIQHFCMGAVGTQHGEDYYISDRQKAVYNPAAVMLCLIFDLLDNNALLAHKVMREYEPLYPTKEAYFKAIDQINQTRDLVEYRGDCVVLHF